MTDVVSAERKGININCTIVWKRGPREGRKEKVMEKERREMAQTSCPDASIVRPRLFHFRLGTIENSSETPILRCKWPSTLPALFLQLKKFVQRINNGRRTTVSKCRVYLATNKASTRRYSQERCLSFLLLPFSSLYLLALSRFRLPVRTAGNFKWFRDALWKERAAHSQRDKSSPPLSTGFGASRRFLPVSSSAHFSFSRFRRFI